jgi:hypothetical protein
LTGDITSIIDPSPPLALGLDFSKLKIGIAACSSKLSLWVLLQQAAAASSGARRNQERSHISVCPIHQMCSILHLPSD